MPLLTLATVWLLAGGCTQDEDAPTSTATAGTTTPTMASTPASSATVTPSPTATVPPGMKRHFQPASHVTGAFQFFYPADWTILAGDVLPDQERFSIVLWSPEADQASKEFPRAATKIDISVAPVSADYGCNLDDRAAVPQADAVGGISGLELHPEPSNFDFGTGTLREVIIVSVTVGDFEYCAVGMFGHDALEAPFRTIVASFEFLS